MPRNRIQEKKKEIRKKLEDLVPRNSREGEELARRYRELAANIAKQKKLSNIYSSLNHRKKDIAKQEADVLRKLAELEDPFADNSSAVAISPSLSSISMLSSEEIDRTFADFDFNDPFLLSKAA
ncbi:uncharacterized protein KY384_003963 [Bacidia gigantensis]|uniref:uncharacterized protein n=1 Tax=Bacidia gigantensis TaxID=2732470 RepID=UPI001D0385A9|nr:uncharacterized protein KY384_003963 [Bacidia gigantensis]KAG8532322.1 hypothetical protein KY384_003963 [Bacidia gigantensis]